MKILSAWAFTCKKCGEAAFYTLKRPMPRDEWQNVGAFVLPRRGTVAHPQKCQWCGADPRWPGSYGKPQHRLDKMTAVTFKGGLEVPALVPPPAEHYMPPRSGKDAAVGPDA